MDVFLVVRSRDELDPEEIEQLTLGLRAEIAELEVESINLLPGATAPAGAKGSDAVTLGAIAVAQSASGGVFTQLIGTVRDWLGWHSTRHHISVTIDGDTLELEQASADERRELIDTFIQRHSVGS